MPKRNCKVLPLCEKEWYVQEKKKTVQIGFSIIRGFQDSTGGLGRYLLWIRGDYYTYIIWSI